MKRVKITELQPQVESKISGWIDVIRNTKYMVFVILKDISGKVQVSIDKNEQPKLTEQVLELRTNCVVSFFGKLVINEKVSIHGVEFLPTSMEVESVAEALPIDADTSIDQRLLFRWLDLREDGKHLIFKIQTELVNAMREHLLKNSFIELHSPKLIGAASESGSEVFEVEYFDKKAYLSQSPQFYKQMAMASGFERIFEVGPVFRAEHSYTSRHSTEFTSFDLEFSYIESFDDVMKLEEEMITHAFKVVEEKFGKELKEVFGKELVVPTLPFPRMKLQEVYDEIEKEYGYKIENSQKNDLTTEAEKLSYELVKKKYNHEFLFVTDYPKEKRAFYHMRKDGALQGYDLIWRGVEITTGAQREHRYDILKQQAQEKGLGKDVQFYLDFFKYGCPPHGGFAIGVDRLTMLMLGLPSLKEAQYIFRGPKNLYP